MGEWSCTSLFACFLLVLVMSWAAGPCTFSHSEAVPPNGSCAAQRWCLRAPKQPPGHLCSGIYCPEWELTGPWQLLPVLLSNTQRLSWSSEQHSRGGGNNLCLERAETDLQFWWCCGEYWGLVLHSSLPISPVGQGEKDAPPGGGTCAPAPSLRWALFLAQGLCPHCCMIKRVLSVRSHLVVTGSLTWKKSTPRKSISQDCLWILGIKSWFGQQFLLCLDSKCWGRISFSKCFHAVLV